MSEVKLAKVVNIRQEIFGKLAGFNMKTRLTRHSALEQLKLNQRVQYVLLVDSSPVPADRLIEAGMIKPCKRKTRKGIKGRWYIVPKDQAFISLVPAPPSHKSEPDMASYAKMQAKLTKAIRSRKHNTRPARIYALLDAGIEPDADGIARLVVFYRASGLQDCHKSRILQHRQAILR